MTCAKIAVQDSETSLLERAQVSTNSRADVVPDSGSELSSAGGVDRRPPDLVVVEVFFQLLARAVHQYRRYPADSPLCADAVAACHNALAACAERDLIVCDVMPQELLIDEIGIGSGTIIEHELGRYLHRLRVSRLTIERSASLRDLSRFCRDVVGAFDGVRDAMTLNERLVEHGVDTIAAQVAHRPEVLNLGAPSAQLCDLVEHERNRRPPFATGDPFTYLYPKDKGWVRLDTAGGFDAISLGDLAIFAEDPTRLALMLQQLIDGEAGAQWTPQRALEDRFSSVGMLFSSLEPQVARIMFEKLAQAVLKLEPTRRQELLRLTILPNLLDGQPGGMILRDFPDADLAESLLLLLDLGAAKTQLVWNALDDLELPAERRQVVATLLEAEVQVREGSGRGADPHGEKTAVDYTVQHLMQVKGAEGKAFADFAAFNLSIDDGDRLAMAQIQGELDGTDSQAVRLKCLSVLIRIEPSPAKVEKFLAQAVGLVAELEWASRWEEIAAWLEQQQEVAETLREKRSDVADAIVAVLDAFWTADRMLRLVDLYETGGETRAVATRCVANNAASFAAACVAVLEDSSMLQRAQALVSLMCENATLLAPELCALLDHAGDSAARAVVKVLGFAGPGVEAAVARQVERGNEHLTRQALRALVQIATEKAASLIARQIQSGIPWIQNAAVEALWRCPPPQTAGPVRDLLSQYEFAVLNPKIAARLLERAASEEIEGLGEAVRALTPLRFRFWNPALVRIGVMAHKMTRR
jgi:hypothetical protein